MVHGPWFIAWYTTTMLKSYQRGTEEFFAVRQRYLQWNSMDYGLWSMDYSHNQIVENLFAQSV